ncbi:MAG: hypothetical protein ACYTEQ_13585 [Planctomycetota bacterium]|jgi:hypothetical protein
MMNSRISQLAMALILTCTWTSVFGAEPNEAKGSKTELNFEVGSGEKPWVRDEDGSSGQGPIKPSHVCELFVEPRYPWSHFRPRLIREILETSAARGMSARQREFLTTCDAMVWTNFGNILKGHNQLRLYAVSEVDAKKMVDASMEFFANRAKAKVEELLKIKRRAEQKLSEAEKLPEKEAEVEAAQRRFDAFKKTVRYRSVSEAYESIGEFNKILNSIEVEIAGIQASLQAIREFQGKRRKGRVDMAGAADKLLEMVIHQTIELRSAEARRRTAMKLRKEAEELCDLKGKLDEAKTARDALAGDLSGYKTQLVEIEKRLAVPRPEMLPPKVYENKVTIYRVRVEE